MKWKLDARQHVKNHIMCMYPMLPTMGNVDDVLLLEAIDELLNHYKDDEAGLQRRLLWMHTFLGRAELDPQVIMKVRKRLDTLQHLLEQSEFVRRQRAIGVEIGKIEKLREVIVYIASLHHPELGELAQQTVEQLRTPDALDSLLRAITQVQDKTSVRAALLTAQVLP